jgi:hypothetical protein
MGRQAYYVSFTNDKSHYTQTHLLSHKSDTFNAYLQFEAWLKMQHSASIKIVRSDWGGEFLSAEFSDHLKSKGTV